LDLAEEPEVRGGRRVPEPAGDDERVHRAGHVVQRRLSVQFEPGVAAHGPARQRREPDVVGGVAPSRLARSKQLVTLATSSSSMPS
jgi:hypothetical protein